MPKRRHSFGQQSDGHSKISKPVAITNKRYIDVFAALYKLVNPQLKSVSRVPMSVFERAERVLPDSGLTAKDLAWLVKNDAKLILKSLTVKDMMFFALTALRRRSVPFLDLNAARWNRARRRFEEERLQKSREKHPEREESSNVNNRLLERSNRSWNRMSSVELESLLDATPLRISTRYKSSYHLFVSDRYRADPETSMERIAAEWNTMGPEAKRRYQELAIACHLPKLEEVLETKVAKDLNSVVKKVKNVPFFAYFRENHERLRAKYPDLELFALAKKAHRKFARLDEGGLAIWRPKIDEIVNDLLACRPQPEMRVASSADGSEVAGGHNSLAPDSTSSRSFLHAPHDVSVKLRTDEPLAKCFIPKKLLHTWTGHKEAVQALRWFPKTAHLLLSAAMDGTCKLWEAYGDRRCVATYNGHLGAVRDIQFNNDGSQFISTSYDTSIKVWDTQTRQVKTRLTTGKVPFCVRYNPDEDKQHMILTGMGDKKIIQWDLRSGETVQEYDQHLGAVHTITFFDENRRFCTTSDDKSMRIWEWEIPVHTKLIQDASMLSMPAVTHSPNKKWLAAQSMDNRVIIFKIIDEKVRFSRKKTFRGHNVSGYACCPDFSPDMSYLISGDADGRVWVWDWKTQKTLAKWKAHEQPCIDVKWNPHETSKVATAGFDGLIHYWD